MPPLLTPSRDRLTVSVPSNAPFATSETFPAPSVAHESSAQRLTIDPQNEETPGVATPGDPRDIPVGKDGTSMRRHGYQVKGTRKMRTRRWTIEDSYSSLVVSNPGSSGSMPARHSSASAAAWRAAPQSAAAAARRRWASWASAKSLLCPPGSGWGPRVAAGAAGEGEGLEHGDLPGARVTGDRRHRHQVGGNTMDN